MKNNKGGQPTKFTQEVKDKLIVAIKKGATYELACNYAGICYITLLNWRKLANEKEIPAYIQIFRDLKEAEGHTALIWLDKIDKAMADGCWQAAAWKLERRHYRGYSSSAAVIELSEEIQRMKDETGALKDGNTDNSETK
jgi:hypothetical protein